MSKIGKQPLLAREEYRPAIAAFATAIGFCLWKVVFDPRFYIDHVASRIAFTGDLVIDAEIYRAIGSLLLILMIVAIIRLVFRQSLSEYGFGIGQWTRAPVLILATPLLLVFAYLGAQRAEYQAFYPQTPGLADRSFSVFLFHIAIMATFYVAWEFLFRGFLQSSLVPRLGVMGAIAVQTLASSLAHADRPDTELIGSIIIGAIWGFLAHRTGSIWPCVLQHMLLGLALDYFLCFG